MEHANQPSPNGSGHELREVNVGFLVGSLFALLFGTFLVCLLVVGIFQFFAHTYETQKNAQASPFQLPPEPRIEEYPWKQLITLREHEDHLLSTYALIDPKQGIVRVPVDRAIDMLAQKGLPHHDYLDDVLAGRKPPMPPPAPPAPKKAQGSTNAK
jgi:hypothetical protein